MKYHDDQQVENLITYLDGNIEEISEEKSAKLEELKALAQKDNDPKGWAAYFFYLAMDKVAVGKIDESTEFTERSLSYAEKSDYHLFIIKASNSLGINYAEKTNYLESIKYYLKAYHVAINNPDTNYDWIILNNIGNLFVWLGDFENAVTFVESAYNKYVSGKMTNKEHKAILIINIIELYSFSKDYDKVDHWMSLYRDEYSEEGKLILESMRLMNEIVYNKDIYTHDEIENKMKEFLESIKPQSNFIYIFRMGLKVLEIAIDTSREDIVTCLIEVMKEKRSKSEISTFDLSFNDLLCYYELCNKNSENQFVESFKNYYYSSKEYIEMVKDTYSQGLLVQIALSEEKEAHKNSDDKRLELQKKIEVDSFTNLYNKTHAKNKIVEHLNSRSNHENQALIILDIDRFKQVNDELGHDKGDKVLLEVASILKKYNKDNSIVGRYGGDEFILYIRHVKSLDDLKQIAENLNEEAHKIKIQTKQMKEISFSMGISLVKNEDNFDRVFKRADQALYQSKHKGRNCYTISDM